MKSKTYSVLHLFSGLGGGALGFQAARAKAKGLEGRFETLLGVDVSKEACEDFERLTGAPSLCADLAELEPAELLRACRGRSPDVVFTSPPCKGFSGLLSNSRAATKKYQQLNQLVHQGLFLTLEAFKQKPGLILLENVPRIRNRGKQLLDQVKQLLGLYGYVFNEGTHDCGELGGLSQHRKRYLLIARQPKRLPRFVYHPAQRRVRSIGDCLKALPMPDASAAGAMHRLPRLKWQTLVRLALIPAGKDWRALGVRDKKKYNNAYRIVRWDRPSVAVTGGGHPSSGGINVADPRGTSSYANLCRVEEWDKPAHTVTGATRPASGAPSVADPRFPGEYRGGTYGVSKWDQPSGTVTGRACHSTGSFTVADPRWKGSQGQHGNKYRVERWEEPAHTVTGSDRVGSGAPSVADPRLKRPSRPNLFRVLAWDQPALTVTGSASCSGSNGAAAVADPRIDCQPRAGTYGVQSWDQPAKTVTGALDVHAGPGAVADPRISSTGTSSRTTQVPKPGDKLEPPAIIISTDGSWHRPLTTLELAALQGLPVKPLMKAPLAGKSHSRWRERIGNAVPPPTAKAIAGEVLKALTSADANDTQMVLVGAIWVRRKDALDITVNAD